MFVCVCARTLFDVSNEKNSRWNLTEMLFAC